MFKKIKDFIDPDDLPRNSDWYLVYRDAAPKAAIGLTVVICMMIGGLLWWLI